MFEGIPLRMAPGLACADDKSGPDVMRGEETQIFGALGIYPGLRDRNVRVVLPGTHSKWARVEKGKILNFRTSLSGELFALLRDKSILLSLGAQQRLPMNRSALQTASLAL
jgi:2-dehydro-3-deoxygalactonokinase